MTPKHHGKPTIIQDQRTRPVNKIDNLASENALVGAGSVVVRDVPEGVIGHLADQPISSP